MKAPHQRAVPLLHSFQEVYPWLLSRGTLTLTTRAGTSFHAVSSVVGTQQVIRFMQGAKEYGRVKTCCWGHYTNCAGTWIGMYCVALDEVAGSCPALDHTSSDTGLKWNPERAVGGLEHVISKPAARRKESAQDAVSVANVIMGTSSRWTTPQALIADLSRVPWETWFANRWTEHRDHDWRWIIEHFVASNTFRAFRHMPEPPSVVFRDWAYDALFGTRRAFNRLLAITSASDYDEWFGDLSANLRQFWLMRMGHDRAIGFGHSMKLPGLVMKGVCCSPCLPRPVFDRIVWFLHVPLDSFSIRALRCYLPGSPFAERIGTIPSSAMMGFVKTPQMYRTFQDCISHLCGEASVPPIALDILAWDAAHE